MYFCQEFFGTTNNIHDAPEEEDDCCSKEKEDDCCSNEKEDNNMNTTPITEQEVVVTISREERMKEMDDTFLGKVIQCGGCGDIDDV